MASMPSTLETGATFAFGPFWVSAERREVLCSGVPVQLGSRAFDLLVALLRREGQLVTKDELMAEVWPDTVVEENNLKVQISALRKVLEQKGVSERCLVTIPGRGYRFTASVTRGHTGFADAGAPLPLPNKPSIAVLPFTNMSGDSGQEYFADGVVEDITTALTRFPSLFVIARNSSFTYKGRAVDIKQVGRELGVRYVLEGSVRRVKNRVRITGQLVETEMGAHLWAERYDRDLGDIFALQDEMTTSIVGALVPSLQRAEIERAQRTAPSSFDAYDLYLRALAGYYLLTREGNDNALHLLEQALLLDSKLVAAIILVEGCWGIRFAQGWSPPAEAHAQSMRYARLAVQLDPDNADALATLARRLASIEGDHDQAVALAERAVARNPNSAYAWRQSARAFVFAGLPEKALSHYESAMRLNPRDPRVEEAWSGIALALIQLQRDNEAIVAARSALRTAPNSAPAWRALTAALALTGQLDEARACIHRLQEIDPTCSVTNIASRFAFTPKARARYFKGLRKAGMAE